MKNYNEIKDIIINKLGITDLETYKKYVESYHNDTPRFISKEDIELLSPDNINNYDFWKVIEELFGTDCVSNINFGSLPQDKISCNRRNLNLARLMGCLTFLEEHKFYKNRILEIGSGYGCLKNWIEAETRFEYVGVDVYPKVQDVQSVSANGLFTEEQKKEKYDFIYSSNVFQHLSHNQRMTYLDDISNMLNKESGGIFIVNLMLLFNDIDVKYHAEDGKVYLKHYGQFTSIPTVKEWVDELNKRFTILYSTTRNADTGACKLANFICYKPYIKV